jgi:hypothetical protein
MYIYVMGRGHSGSTILDLLLGNAKEIQSVGELISGVDRYDSLCACGQSFKDCEFWKRVRREFEQRTKISWDIAARSLKRQAHVRSLLRTLLSRSGSAWISELRIINTEIAHAIRSSSGRSAVMDSSKEFTRALFLCRHVPEAKIIHLVRHPKSLLASHYWRISRGDGFRFLRHTYKSKLMAPLFLTVSAGAWVLGNLLGELVRLIAPSRVLLVHYEDLCVEPSQELLAIAKFLDADLSEAIRKIEAREPLAIGHSLAGNRIRRKAEVRFDPGRGERPLQWWYALLAKAVCWPLMLRYGYGVFHRSDRRTILSEPR